MTGGKVIRERRAELGLTQEEVALRGGPSVAWLRTVESEAQGGQSRPGVLARLDRVLGWPSGTCGRLVSGELTEPPQGVLTKLHAVLGSVPLLALHELEQVRIAVETAIAIRSEGAR